MTPAKVKEKFRKSGTTFSDWARENGYKPHDVYRVLNGFVKCSFGKSHDIAVKLGLKKDSK